MSILESVHIPKNFSALNFVVLGSMVNIAKNFSCKNLYVYGSYCHTSGKCATRLPRFTYLEEVCVPTVGTDTEDVVPLHMIVDSVR